MGEKERELCLALARCTMLPGSQHKRFARDLARAAKSDPERELSERQRQHLLRLAWRYRRQMPAHLLAGIEQPKP